MRTIAIDYGRRRTGVAVSDALGLSARGVATLKNLSDISAVERIVALVADWVSARFGARQIPPATLAWIRAGVYWTIAVLFLFY